MPLHLVVTSRAVTKQVHDTNLPTLGLGVRSISKPEETAG